jgi:hypothetical protein
LCTVGNKLEEIRVVRHQEDMAEAFYVRMTKKGLLATKISIAATKLRR